MVATPMLPGSTRPKFGWPDALILGGLALAIGYVFLQVGVVLNYQWQWSALPRFFLRFDEAANAWIPNLLLLGLLTTLRLSLWGGVIALLVGALIGLLRISPALTLRLLGGTYVEAIRNIPPLVFIFIFFFFFAGQLLPLTGIAPAVRRASPETLAVLNVLFGEPRQLTSFLAAAIALGLFSASYVAEVIRSGIESVGKGQWESGQALGLRRGVIMRRIILPQALATIWPPLVNQLILLIKFSSLASLVSVPDLTFQAFQVGVTTRGMFEVWLVVAGLYFIICAGLASIFAALERHSKRHLAR